MKYIGSYPSVFEFITYAGFKNSEENFMINESPINTIEEIFNNFTEFCLLNSKFNII